MVAIGYLLFATGSTSYSLLVAASSRVAIMFSFINFSIVCRPDSRFFGVTAAGVATRSLDQIAGGPESG